ncbi:MAG: DUF2127 domain-containing protein [Treponema sp.]|nr:DUF2127 domain-containing protein [Treponema sp.]
MSRGPSRPEAGETGETGVSNRRRRAQVLHETFEAGILLKGAHAILEMIGAVLLWFVKPESLSRLVRFLTQGELSEDPRDYLVNLMLQASQRYSVSAQHFGVFYLLSHGLVNLGLVFLLWRRKLWAYPAVVAVLCLFIAYQVLRWTGTHSFFLIFLSLFDAAMIWLTLVEYRRLHGDPRKREARR